MRDDEIIALYFARSERAIAAAQEQYGSYCRTIARNILGSEGDAEECVNDTLLRSWNAIPPQRPERLGAFLGAVTRNLALNRLERNRAEKRGGGQGELALSELEECLPAPRGVEEALEERAAVRAIEAFLRAQPRSRRRIFIRRYWYASPIKEIARDWGYSESKTASLLRRMREELKQYLEQEGITL